MAFTSDVELKIPFSELTFILPEQRVKFFHQLMNDYKVYVPSLKLIYAYLHWGDDSKKTKEVTIHRNNNFDDIPVVDINPDEKATVIDKYALDPNYLNGIKDAANKGIVEEDDKNKSLSYEDSEFSKRKDGETIEVPVFDQPCMIDYVFIFTVTVSGVETVFIDAPYIYSKRSLPGYRYCMRENKQRDFFIVATDEMTRIPRKLFNEFITEMCHLSLDKDSPQFWKKEESYDSLIQNLVGLNLRYIRKRGGR